MRLIREGVFETNSSSTHSLTMCTGSIFNDWKEGKVLFLEDDCTFFVAGSLELRDFFAKGVLTDKCSYNFDTKLYSDGTATYTKEELFSRERLDSVTEEEIRKYREEYWYECPLTYSDWVDRYGEEYELFEQHKTFDGTEVVGFGYFGNDY